ncbi:MAG: N-acetylmannosaminyltransferase [Peptococcaceae bacterium BRH_c4b]|nr:MAG: N-acetylmannosaminyltransferase [Peptococcaceae bacterium BRH_c4b]
MKVNLLGAGIDRLSIEECTYRIGEFIEQGAPRFVVTLNPELLYQAQFYSELLDMVNQADLVTPDGVGIVWACRVKGEPVPGRVTGIDLMLGLLERAAEKGWRVFLLGSAPGVAEDAALNIVEKYPGLHVVGTHHGYFTPGDEPGLIEAIRKTRPHLLFVALGAPRQEQWIYAHRQRLGVPVAMGIGGSLDVLAGRVPRAPAWMQTLHVEWLGRLLRQPSRWRRMLVLPKFAFMVLRTYLKKGRIASCRR